MQYDEEKIVGGSRDNTIKMWDWTTKQCLRTYVGHEGSVLCLQYDDDLLVSGSSDCTVRCDAMRSSSILRLYTFRSAVYGTSKQAKYSANSYITLNPYCLYALAMDCC